MSENDSKKECVWCGGENHTMKSCYKRHMERRNSSKDTYTAAELRENDKLGFAAAGVLAWKPGKNYTGNEKSESSADSEDKQVLLAWEERKGHAAFNTLGGKRDLPTETAWDTALREFDEESGFQLKQMEHYRSNRPEVLLFSDKYVMFVVELHPDDYDIDQRTKELFLDNEAKICPGDQGLQHLQFVSLSDFMNKKVLLHSFTSLMIPHLKIPK